MHKNKSKISIIDVANHAGVGVGTVSRAINNTGSISPKTKQKIMDSINELGYIPNRLAQSLRSQEYKNIVFFVNLEVTTFSRILNGMYTQFEYHGYMLSLCNIGESNILDKIKSYTSYQHFDGVILATPIEVDKELNEYLQSLDVPVVTFELSIPGLATGITVDYHSAVMQAANYLFSLNHRNIALLCGSTNIPTNIGIIGGFREAFANHNIELQEELIIRSNASSNKIIVNELSLLMPQIRRKEISAILCMHTAFLPQLLQVMKDAKIRYPDDVSLIAVEDYELTKLLDPSITVIKRPLFDMGKKAAETLLKYIQQPDLYGQLPSNIISTEFIIRESCKILKE
ncbi:LacI family DNA-binding transcriptional regulator [Bacillus sp. Marseille-P3661]|uniref:LacI family DNA-binding transcriptional regulator n=1 Tax=Bacillus sp. Marseille-P3661 TaxID=1936234 RepID=UPI000C84B8EC|nr:LacI family DNA-binding transcriptional regulator [Bacillus sp. Marseille-P3661]